VAFPRHERFSPAYARTPPNPATRRRSIVRQSQRQSASSISSAKTPAAAAAPQRQPLSAADIPVCQAPRCGELYLSPFYFFLPLLPGGIENLEFADELIASKPRGKGRGKVEDKKRGRRKGGEVDLSRLIPFSAPGFVRQSLVLRLVFGLFLLFFRNVNHHWNRLFTRTNFAVELR